jgi:hypothetical protein
VFERGEHSYGAETEAGVTEVTMRF